MRCFMQDLNSAIMITPAAINHFQNVLAKNVNAKGIHLYIKKSGCSGYSYVLEVADQNFVPKTQDLQIKNDTVTVFIDYESVSFLSGTRVDVLDKGLGQKQVVFDNPNVMDACGCGESFTVKQESDKGE